MKLWDKLVFDKEVKLTKDKKFLAPVGEQKSFSSNENFITKFGKKDGGGGGGGGGKGGGGSGNNYGKGKENAEAGGGGAGANAANKKPFNNYNNSKFSKDGKFANSKFKDPSELIEEFDKLGRPEQKVVLIAGPPGLGKTTLAHIVAKHVGYNVQVAIAFSNLVDESAD